MRTSATLPSVVWNFGGNGSNHYKINNAPTLSGLTSGSSLLGIFTVTITGSGGIGSPWIFLKSGSKQAYNLVANNTGSGSRGGLSTSGFTQVSVQLALDSGASSSASMDWHFLDGSSSFKITSLSMALIEFIK